MTRGVLRIGFTRDDLQRISIASAPDPLWELVLSLHQIQERDPAPRYAAWHRDSRLRVAGHDGARAVFGTLCTLVPRMGSFPDFLTPSPWTSDIDAGCERVVCTERGFLRTDLAQTFARRRAPSWVRDLAAGDRRRRTELAASLKRAHDLLLRPHWADVQRDVAADRTTRLRTLSTTGVQGLLAGLPGVLGWDGETLEVRYPVNRTLRLEGRGLTLVPTRFCWSHPITFMSSELTPVLAYRAGSGTGADDAGPSDARRLTALLGPNRADCLATLVRPHTTSSLAERVGISVGSASKQATTLREAGLVVSERHGNAVVHRASSLGTALLAGELPGA